MFCIGCTLVLGSVSSAWASDFDIGPENLLCHFRGPTDSSEAGLYLRPLGDINGDDFDDIAISCLENTATENSLGSFILFGSNAVDSIPDMLVRGDWATTPVDFTGDGIPDLATRERSRDQYGLTRSKILFYRGYADSLASEPCDSMAPPDYYSRFASQFESGYIDSDSLGDIVTLHTSYPGGDAIMYFSSPLTTDTVADWIYQIQNYSHYFSDLSLLDFNADGFIDIAVGLVADKDPDSLNSVSFFFGPDFGSQPDLSILASTSVGTLNPLEFARFSTEVGDIDADGVSDICVIHQGIPIIYFGEPLPLTRSPLFLNTYGVLPQYSHPVANVGDINSDGYPDIALSTIEYTWQGSLELFLGGPDFDADADDILVPADLPPVALEDNGRTIAAAGDVNGDGIDDFMFSAGSISFFDYGDVFVYSGDSGTLTDVDDDSDRTSLPKGFELQQNYPNPFNPTTTISFSLPVRSHAEVAVFNVMGRRVAELEDRELTAGPHEVIWDGRSSNGQTVSSGVYLYRLKAGEYTAVRKMVLVK